MCATWLWRHHSLWTKITAPPLMITRRLAHCRCRPIIPRAVVVLKHHQALRPAPCARSPLSWICCTNTVKQQLHRNLPNTVKPGRPIAPMKNKCVCLIANPWCIDAWSIALTLAKFSQVLRDCPYLRTKKTYKMDASIWRVQYPAFLFPFFSLNFSRNKDCLPTGNNDLLPS